MNTIEVDYMLKMASDADIESSGLHKSKLWKQPCVRDGYIILTPVEQPESVSELQCLVSKQLSELKMLDVTSVVLRIAVFMRMATSTLMFNQDLLRIIGESGTSLEVSTYPTS